MDLVLLVDFLPPVTLKGSGKSASRPRLTPRGLSSLQQSPGRGGAAMRRGARDERGAAPGSRAQAPGRRLGDFSTPSYSSRSWKIG